MHVAHVVSSLEIGGQERVMLDLARAMSARGHRVTVVSLEHGGALRRELGAIQAVSVGRRPGLDPKTAVRVYRILRELGADVVHTHNPVALTYAGPVARLAGVRRLVHTKHGANPVSGAAGLLARRTLARACHAFVAVSEQTAEVARRVELVPERLLRVIANGIDVEVYERDDAARARIRGTLEIAADVCVIGTVGRLAPEKNQRMLLAAAAPLLGPSVHLVVVGDGPEREAFERAIAPSVRAYVHLTGARSDVPALLSAFDLFALSSTTEGLPLVVPEAMAARLPVVSTAVGGLPGVIRDGETGRLVPSGDGAAMSRALREIVSDVERRGAWGEAAHADAKARFDLERVADAYEALYRAAG